MQTRNQGCYKKYLIAVAGMMWLCLGQSIYAQEQTWKIKPNEKLSDIIKQVYPATSDQQAIIAAIIAANPRAFINGDPKKLVAGKTLKLPNTDASSNDKAKSTSKADASTDNATSTSSSNSKTDQADEAASLREKVQDLEKERNTLKSQLDTKEQDLTTNRKTIEDLQGRISELEKRTDTLQADLQAAKEAEQKTANSARWPWIMVGLLALMMVPLLWLLKRSRAKILTPALASAGTSAPSTDFPTPLKTIMTKGADTPAAAATAMAATPAVDKEEPENPEADLKLDIARAYLEWRAPEAATDILQDVLIEGGNRQRQDAKEILSFIN